MEPSGGHRGQGAGRRAARAAPPYAAAEIFRQGRRTALVHVSCWQDRASTPVAHGRVQLLFETAPGGKIREEQ